VVLDALEAAYPMLRGTLRDPVTERRRPSSVSSLAKKICPMSHPTRHFRLPLSPAMNRSTSWGPWRAADPFGQGPSGRSRRATLHRAAMHVLGRSREKAPINSERRRETAGQGVVHTQKSATNHSNWWGVLVCPWPGPSEPAQLAESHEAAGPDPATRCGSSDISQVWGSDHVRARDSCHDRLGGVPR